MPLELAPQRALTLSNDAAGLYTQANLDADLAGQVNASSQFGRGWTSAGLGDEANTLWAKARSAHAAGDTEGGLIYEQQARDLGAQAQQWAPTVRDASDVRGLGSAIDYVGGALGGIRSSVPSALGGLAGAAIGGVGGALMGGVGAAPGALAGARIGSALVGGNQMYDETVAQAMQDENIRATRSYEDIGNAGMGNAIVGGALEAAVPFGVVKSLTGMGAKQLTKAGMAKRVGQDMLTEGATEGAQSLTGQSAQNWLNQDDLTNYDYKQALNEAAAGAIAGGGMGAVGAGADAGYGMLGRGVDKVTDTARDVASDPLGTVLDAGVDLAAKAGTLKAKVDNYFDERELKSKGLTQDEIDQGRLEQIQATLAGKSDLKSTSPLSDEENQMDDQSFNAHHENKLKDDAATILKAGRDSTEAEKSLASQYAAGKIDAVEFQTKLHQTQNDKVAEKETDALLTGLGQNSKKSEMRPSDRMYLESELLKPEAQQQKINTLTDIMVKQGVDEKIIKATNGEHNKIQLAGMLNWINSGMEDHQQAVGAIVERFGEGSASLFKKAYGLATRNGLVENRPEAAKNIEALITFASNKEQIIKSALKNNLSDIALHGVKDVDGAVKKLVPMMKTVVQEGMSAKVKQGLIDNFFGTEERLHNVMNAYIDTGEHKKLVSKATGGGKDQVEIDADGNVVPEQQFDEDGELIVNKYGAGASVSEIKGPKIVGFTNPKGRVGIPFNLGFDKGIEKYEAVKAQHSSELGNSVVDAGIWSRTKKDLNNDAAAIEQAGYDLLESFGPKLSHQGKYETLIKGFSEGTIDIGDLSKRQRAALLGQIDKQFRYLEVTQPDSGDSRHNIQDIDSFKWNPKDAKPETFTAQNGVLFLERNGSKGVTHFPVSTDSLRKQGIFTENGTRAKGKDGGVFPTGNFENQDGPTGTTLEGKRRGALGSSDLVMSALTDLMLAEGGNFTSRIGYRTAPGQPLQWVENLERLPKEMLLGRQHTVGDAKTQADIERREEKPTEFGIGFAENHKERVQALLELAQRETTSSGRAYKIYEALKKGAPAVLQFYRKERNKWQGSPDDFGGTPMSKKDITFARPTTEYDTEKTTEMRRKGQKEGVPAPSEAQGRIEAEDGDLSVSDTEYTGQLLVKFPKEKQLARLEKLYREAVTGDGPALSKAQSDTLKALRAEEMEHLVKYQKSSTKGKKEVERGPDGARIGLGADAAGAGYGGPGSTRSREGTKVDPHVLPSTHEVSTAKKESAQPKAEDKLENVKDRIVAALQKSVASLMSGRATLSQENREIFDIAILGTTRMNKIAEYVPSTQKKGDHDVVSKTTKYVGDRYEEVHTIGLAELSVDKLASLYTLDKAEAAELKVRLGNTADLISGKISSLEEANANNARGSGQGSPVGRPGGNSGNAANDQGEESAISVVGQAQGTGNTGSSKTGVAASKSTEGLLEARATVDKIDSILGSNTKLGAYAKRHGLSKAEALAGLNKARAENYERLRSLEGGKQSTQQPKNQAKGKVHEQVAAAKEHILKALGDNITTLFKRMTDSSGEWTPGQVKNTIKLALNGDVLGAAFHESFHEFVNILEKNGGKASVDVMKRAAMNPIIQRKLERLLDGHPEAIKQLANHEEAAAFMYQFWQAGALKIGPETKSIFQMIKNGLKRVAAVFSETFRKEVEAMSREQLEAGHAERLMRQFSDGAVANADTRQAVVAAINKDTEAHNAAVERVGETFQNFANAAGKLVFSNEAMMDATNNKHMVDIARGFHQKIGTAMRKVGSSYGSYSDGLRQATSHWVHKVENILDGYSPEDIEMARKAMSTETEPTDRVAKELVAKINAFYSEMAGYMAEKGVKRLNMDRIDSETGMKGVWEDIPLRKNYLPQVWSVDALMGDMAGFKESLLKHHSRELQHIADEANKEVKADKLPEKGTAARAEFDRAEQEFKDSGKVMAKLNLQTITAEMVADAIATRLLASNGHIEISESNSGLGITPASSAVNKRELNWLDKDVFDKYKEKDLTSIMTTYAHSIVKRGEYQSRFGPDGGKIAEGADKAVLFELGGDALVEQAEKGLEAARKKWSKQKAAVGDDFSEPFPTLRSVGQDMHVAGVGQEKHDAALLKAMGKLENSFKAIQALEGTLGREISPNARAVSSWIVTYQSFRLMATSLFTNFQDVVGLVVNGGEAKDAWTGFVEGIREIRNTIFDKKDPSAAVADAEFWGTVDSGAYLESTAQAQGSPFMSGKAKVLSDKLFKYNGMVGWNRGVRAAATQVAVRIISGWAKNGIDTNDKAAVSRMEDLFGKGFDPKNIKFGPDGNLEKNAANQAAVTRWVLTAVAAPTAAHRTIWMSDPHYAVFAQLKSYSYSFHRVMMKNAADQARLGNYRPVMAMGLGYMPIAIAAGAIKEMLIPGEEPPWMKGGLDGYLQYGFGRAGVLGVPQMMLGNLVDVSEIPGLNFGKAGAAFDPATLAGPTVDQLQNILSVPFGEFMAMRDHTVIGEGLGALPGGSMLRRLERLGNA